MAVHQYSITPGRPAICCIFATSQAGTNADMFPEIAPSHQAHAALANPTAATEDVFGAHTEISIGCSEMSPSSPCAPDRQCDHFPDGASWCPRRIPNKEFKLLYLFGKMDLVIGLAPHFDQQGSPLPNAPADQPFRVGFSQTAPFQMRAWGLPWWGAPSFFPMNAPRSAVGRGRGVATMRR